MSERVHFADHAGPLCGRGHPCHPKVTRIATEVTCKSCARKLGALAIGLEEFTAVLQEVLGDAE